MVKNSKASSSKAGPSKAQNHTGPGAAFINPIKSCEPEVVHVIAKNKEGTGMELVWGNCHSARDGLNDCAHLESYCKAHGIILTPHTSPAHEGQDANENQEEGDSMVVGGQDGEFQVNTLIKNQEKDDFMVVDGQDREFQVDTLFKNQDEDDSMVVCDQDGEFQVDRLLSHYEYYDPEDQKKTIYYLAIWKNSFHNVETLDEMYVKKVLAQVYTQLKKHRKIAESTKINNSKSIGELRVELKNKLKVLFELQPQNAANLDAASEANAGNDANDANEVNAANVANAVSAAKKRKCNDAVSTSLQDEGLDAEQLAQQLRQILNVSTNKEILSKVSDLNKAFCDDEMKFIPLDAPFECIDGPVKFIEWRSQLAFPIDQEEYDTESKTATMQVFSKFLTGKMSPFVFKAPLKFGCYSQKYYYDFDDNQPIDETPFESCEMDGHGELLSEENETKYCVVAVVPTDGKFGFVFSCNSGDRMVYHHKTNTLVLEKAYIQGFDNQIICPKLFVFTSPLTTRSVRFMHPLSDQIQVILSAHRNDYRIDNHNFSLIAIRPIEASQEFGDIQTVQITETCHFSWHSKFGLVQKANFIETNIIITPPNQPTNLNDPVSADQSTNLNDPASAEQSTNLNDPAPAEQPTNLNDPASAEQSTNLNDPASADQSTNLNDPASAEQPTSSTE